MASPSSSAGCPTRGWVGQPLSSLQPNGDWRLVSLTRAGKATLANPAMLIQENDVVTVAVSGDAMPAFDRHVVDPAGAHQ